MEPDIKDVKRYDGHVNRTLIATATTNVVLKKPVLKNHKFQHKNEELILINKLAKLFNRSHDLAKILSNVFNEITKASIFKEIRLMELNIKNVQTGCSTSFLRVSQSNVPDEYNRHKYNNLHKETNLKEICIPFVVEGEHVGVVNIWYSANQTMSRTTLLSFKAIFNQMGAFIKKAQIYSLLEKNCHQIDYLNEELDNVRDAERKSLARELHDQLGSTLSALSMNLNILKLKAVEQGDEFIKRQIMTAEDLLKETGDIARQIIKKIEKQTFNLSELILSIKHYAEQFAAMTNISVEVIHDDHSIEISQIKQNAIYRIVQEALNNSAKHANATKVKIKIDIINEKIRINIADNGKGFQISNIKGKCKSDHFGLQFIKERVDLLKGEFRIETIPDQGTCLYVEI